MVNDIITGISLKLNELFGDGCPAYSEDVKQGLKKPCFLIGLIVPSVMPLLGKRKFRKHAFDVKYFPTAEDGRAEMQEVGDRLFEGMEYITQLDGTTLYGTSMSYEIVDGVLHFYVSYNFPTITVTEDVGKMESVDTDITTGGN